MKKFFTVLIVALLIVCPNVNAANTWPTGIADEYVSLDVTGINLVISSIEEKTQTYEDDMTTGEVTFIEKTLVKTVTLAKERHPSPATAKTIKSNDSYITYVSLELPLTKQQLEEYAKEAITDIQEGEKYSIDVVVNYNITKYPEKYLYAYSVNFLDELNAALQKKDYSFPEVDLTKELSQIVNTAYYSKEDGVVTFEYETEATETIGGAFFQAFNLLMLTEEKCNETSCDNIETGHGVMISIVKNMDVLLNDEDVSKEEILDDKIEEEVHDKPQEETPKSEEVEVEDTAASFPTGFYLIGVVIILSGSLIIYKVLNKKSKKEENKE